MNFKHFARCSPNPDQVLTGSEALLWLLAQVKSRMEAGQQVALGDTKIFAVFSYLTKPDEQKEINVVCEQVVRQAACAAGSGSKASSSSSSSAGPALKKARSKAVEEQETVSAMVLDFFS